MSDQEKTTIKSKGRDMKSKINFVHYIIIMGKVAENAHFE